MAIDSSKLESFIGFQVKATHQHIFQRFSKVIKEFNLTPTEVNILILVNDNPNISQTDLARKIGIERASFGEVISNLEKKGMVKRYNSTNDTRAKCLNIPKNKKTEFNKIIKTIVDYDHKLTASLSTRELAKLIALLKKVRNNA